MPGGHHAILRSELIRESMKTSNEYIRLRRSEIVSDRSFTHPDRNSDDVALLRYMLARLSHLLSQPNRLSARSGSSLLFLREPGGRRHRVVILNREALLAGGARTVVGFFGRKRVGVDRSMLNEVDAELVDELGRHSDILSYSSLELEDGNWSNMVLMSDPAGIERWGSSEKHIYAARELAPQYYETVRLQNGVLHAGLWRAVRELQVPADIERQRRREHSTSVERKASGESKI